MWSPAGPSPPACAWPHADRHRSPWPSMTRSASANGFQVRPKGSQVAANSAKQIQVRDTLRKTIRRFGSSESRRVAENATCETEQVRLNQSVPERNAIRHGNKIESFGKPAAQFTNTVNLPASPAPSPEEVRWEVAITKNRVTGWAPPPDDFSRNPVSAADCYSCSAPRNFSMWRSKSCRLPAQVALRTRSIISTVQASSSTCSLMNQCISTWTG